MATTLKRRHPIREQAGLLAAFYQGIELDKGVERFLDRALDKKTGKVVPDSKPNLPDPENGAMGPWVSQYRLWIRDYLTKHHSECKFSELTPEVMEQFEQRYNYNGNQ